MKKLKEILGKIGDRNVLIIVSLVMGAFLHFGLKNLTEGWKKTSLEILLSSVIFFFLIPLAYSQKNDTISFLKKTGERLEEIGERPEMEVRIQIVASLLIAIFLGAKGGETGLEVVFIAVFWFSGILLILAIVSSCSHDNWPRWKWPKTAIGEMKKAFLLVKKII